MIDQLADAIKTRDYYADIAQTFNKLFQRALEEKKELTDERARLEADLISRMEALQKLELEHERLKVGLLMYGQHDENGCAINIPNGAYPCDCGYDDLTAKYRRKNGLTPMGMDLVNQASESLEQACLRMRAAEAERDALKAKVERIDDLHRVVDDLQGYLRTADANHLSWKARAEAAEAREKRLVDAVLAFKSACSGNEEPDLDALGNALRMADATLASTPKPPGVTKETCVLCGRRPVGFGVAGGKRLCHSDERDCYHQWTAYGARPSMEAAASIVCDECGGQGFFGKLGETCQACGGSGKPAQPVITEKRIKHMVDRFLTWKLPLDFAPDGGITFTGNFTRYSPVGTNLFTATQAEQMVRYMLEGATEEAPR